MCLCAAELRGAWAAGSVRRVFELALQPCERKVCPPSRVAERLAVFAKAHAHSRELARAEDVRRDVARLFVAAHELLPESIERLWRSEGDVGVAWFPVVTEGLREATVFAVRAEAGGHGEAGEGQRLEGSFRQAVEQARRFALSHFALGPSKQRVRSAKVTVLPSPEAWLKDGSAALAAFVAFSSLAAGAPVKASLAFSGELDGDDFVFPNGTTIADKLRAVSRHGQFHDLVCPRAKAPERDASWGSEGSLLLLNWQEVLERALGQSFRELEAEIAGEPGPFGGRSGSIEVRTAEGTARELRVLSLLSAAGARGLEPYELERALEAKSAFAEAVSFAAEPAERVGRRLLEAGRASLCGKAWVATAPGEVTRRQLEHAHGALEQTFEALGDRGRRAFHLASLDRWDDAASSVLSAGGVASQAAALGRLLEGLEAPLAPLAASLARLSAPSSLRLALACSLAPEPLPSLARRLARCETPLERLFWLQAALEALLHLLSAAALRAPAADLGAGARTADDADRDYEKRPSLGVLCKVAARLQRAQAGVAFALAPSARALPRGIDSAFNRLVHHHGAWLELSRQPGAAVDEQVEELASKLLAAFEALASSSVTLSHDPTSGAWAMAGGGASLSLGAHLAQGPGPCFCRGSIDGAARYWSFDEVASWEPLPDGDICQGVLGADAPLPLARAALSGGDLASEPPVSELPQPLARGWVALRHAPDLVSQIGWVDVVFGALLRLAVAAELSASPAGPLSDRLLTKRHLLDRLCSSETPLVTSIGKYLTDGEARRRAYAVISTLERLEHAPGPVSGWAEHAAAARGLLGALLRASPFAVGARVRVVGRAEAPGLWLLHDLRPRSCKDRSPELPAGAAAMVDGERVIHLAPFARVDGEAARAGHCLVLFGRFDRQPLDEFSVESGAGGGAASLALR